MARYALTLILLFCGFMVSAQEAPPAPLSAEQENAALRSAETTGALLYRHDRAASVATDAARKVRAFKKDKRVRGWITEQQHDHVVVTFLDQTPAALYRIDVSPDGIAGPVNALDPPAALSDFERGAATARNAALASAFQPCAEKYNSVVLPGDGDADGDWAVYLLPATTKKNLLPFGGTYRMAVNGSSVTGQRAFSRSCAVMQNDPNMVALMITHLLDPVPTEAHVFANLSAGKPLYVATAPSGNL